MDITQTAFALTQVKHVYKAHWETPRPVKRRFKLHIPFASRPVSRPLKPRLS